MNCLADLTHGERRALLLARHGLPVPADAAAALRLLGLRGEVHPFDVVAFLYRDEAAAQGWAEANACWHGHPSLGRAPAEGGVVGVTDLRPAFARAVERSGGSWEPTDPGLPDDWPRQGGGERTG